MLFASLFFSVIPLAAAFPSFAGHVTPIRRANCVANTTGLRSFPDAGHPFMDPGPTDQRGPCPGLNALANHGYIPRTGIVNCAEVINACTEVYNMGVDLATFLCNLELLTVGNPLTGLVSIGGPDARTGVPVQGGLDYHAGIEGDGSATRYDAYFGDNHSFQPGLYEQMKAQADATGGLYTPAAVYNHAVNRFEDSIARNPNFTFIPNPCLMLTAAKAFVFEFFGNGTYELGGCPTETSVGSFFGAKILDNGTITRVPERIPPLWYRRATPYGLTPALVYILSVLGGGKIRLGANAGRVNTFTPAPYNITAETSPAALACIIKQGLVVNLPTIAAAVLLPILENLEDVVFAQYGCPPWNGPPGTP